MEDSVLGTNGFVNGVNTTSDYSYDGNGNLTADLNKSYTSILYNYLNLPKRVGTTTAGQYISYIYNAAGSKLAKIGTTGTYTYYAGGFVYNGSSLSYIIHEEGHIESSGEYKYYLKDHLGSVRLIVNTTGTGGTIERQTDYYPFGMTIAEYNGSVVDYGYNGKELQDDLINTKKLDWYDYGARFYDPQIGRFTTIDPLMEWHFNYTPYHYTFNNPINYLDPFGQDTVKSKNVDWPKFNPNKDIIQLDDVTVSSKRPSWFKRALRAIGRFFSEGDGENVEGGYNFVTEQGGASPTKTRSNNPTETVNVDLLLKALNFPSAGPYPGGSSLSIPKALDKVRKLTSITSDKEIVESSTGPSEKRDSHGNDIKNADDYDNKNDSVIVKSDSIDYRYEDDGYGARFRAAYKGDTLVKYRKSKVWKNISK